MLEYDSDASLDPSLATVNTLLPVHTGEGVVGYVLQLISTTKKM